MFLNDNLKVTDRLLSVLDVMFSDCVEWDDSFNRLEVYFSGNRFSRGLLDWIFYGVCSLVDLFYASIVHLEFKLVSASFTRQG